MRMGTIGTSVTGVFSLQKAQSDSTGPSSPWYVRQYSIATVRAGLDSVSPNLAFVWSVPQCAAVVTIDGCTSVPVHPLSSTVVGHWQVVASLPPKMGCSI